MTTIVKATSKGQITLPIHFRRQVGTDRFIIEDRGNKLEIIPLDLRKKKEEEYYTVFDAIRDNKGKGIKAEDLLRILKKIK